MQCSRVQHSCDVQRLRVGVCNLYLYADCLSVEQPKAPGGRARIMLMLLYKSADRASLSTYIYRIKLQICLYIAQKSIIFAYLHVVCMSVGNARGRTFVCFSPVNECTMFVMKLFFLCFIRAWDRYRLLETIITLLEMKWLPL